VGREGKHEALWSWRRSPTARNPGLRGIRFPPRVSVGLDSREKKGKVGGEAVTQARAVGGRKGGARLPETERGGGTLRACCWASASELGKSGAGPGEGRMRHVSAWFQGGFSPPFFLFIISFFYFLKPFEKREFKIFLRQHMHRKE